MLDTTEYQLKKFQEPEIQQEIQTIYLEEEQANILHCFSDEIALLSENHTYNMGGQKILR